MFETFSNKAVTNLIYRYTLVVPYEIVFFCMKIRRLNLHTHNRKRFQKTQTKMTMTVSTNPETVTLGQGII